jgi:hypothetical protein
MGFDPVSYRDWNLEFYCGICNLGFIIWNLSFEI